MTKVLRNAHSRRESWLSSVTGSICSPQLERLGFNHECQINACKVIKTQTGPLTGYDYTTISLPSGFRERRMDEQPTAAGQLTAQVDTTTTGHDMDGSNTTMALKTQSSFGVLSFAAPSELPLLRGRMEKCSGPSGQTALKTN